MVVAVVLQIEQKKKWRGEKLVIWSGTKEEKQLWRERERKQRDADADAENEHSDV